MDDRLRRKFLEKQGSMTVKDALENARLYEATEAGARVMSQSSYDAATVRQVRQVSRKPIYNQKSSNIECGSCGFPGHEPLSKFCPACNQEFHRCKKLGHFQRKCRAKVSKFSKPTRNSGGTHHVQEVAPDVYEGPSQQAEYWGIGQVNSKKEGRDPLFVTVLVEDLPLRMEVDTGAQVSLIPDSLWKANWPQVPIQTSKLQLRQLKLDWPSLLHVNTVTQATTDFVTEFPAVFKDGLGTVKDHEAEITLTDDAKPKCCSARPVPYAIRSAVDKELDRLEQEGIIKPVESAIWASPVVVAPKKNGDIRLCADLKVTINKHIDSRQHPIPNPNELLSHVAGGSVSVRWI